MWRSLSSTATLFSGSNLNGGSDSGWDHLEVTVLCEGVPVGSYRRNYPSLYSTFCPFEYRGKHYALYSPHCTATRVMSLPDCVDVAGEGPSPGGFCPTGFCVPMVTVRSGDASEPEPVGPGSDWALKVPLVQGGTRWYWPDDRDHPQPDEAKKAAYLAARAAHLAAWDDWDARHPHVTRQAEFGFVCGCVWGDDSGDWKLQYLDLSRLAEGVISRDDRLGYVELMGGHATLAAQVDCDDWEPERQVVSVGVRQRFDLSKRQ